MTDELRVDVYMPLYVRDFLTSTFGWTAEERGHYLTLLMLAWDRGGLPAELEQIERLSPGITSSWPLLVDKFPVDGDGMRRNARLEKHRTKCVGLKEKRVNAAKRAAAARAAAAIAGANVEQTLSNRGALLNHPTPTSTPTPTPTSTSSKEEEIHTHTPTPVGEREPWQGKALDRWVPFREEWNQTEGAEPWTPLTPPSGSAWLECVSNSSWLEQYPIALSKLAGLRRFKHRVTLTQFLSDGWVGRIVAGDFDKEITTSRQTKQRPAASNF